MSGFLDSKEEKSPSVFIQWKGTDVCMDFYCDCGAHCHFDGCFAYEVQCQHCQTIWEMPCMLYPRKLPSAPVNPGFVKLLEPDEDHCDEVQRKDGVWELVPHPVEVA